MKNRTLLIDFITVRSVYDPPTTHLHYGLSGAVSASAFSCASIHCLTGGFAGGLPSFQLSTAGFVPSPSRLHFRKSCAIGQSVRGICLFYGNIQPTRLHLKLRSQQLRQTCPGMTSLQDRCCCRVAEVLFIGHCGAN